MTRTFEDKPATRERTPLLIGLTGASSSGKTFSALRLATGIQRVAGGPIFYIDTEARRALHYADKFKFQHLSFAAPFGPLDYLAAIEHCAGKGAQTIVIDSTSHEHEGPGGVLEMHETETVRLVAQWRTTADKVKMSAWQRPKSERRKLLNALLQMPINFVFCFRAKEKMDLRGEKPKVLGWMPIAGEEFVYEMTVNCLLYPGSDGVPTWHSQEMGEKAIIKLPGQFRAMFTDGQPLSEDTGEQLAKWAAGGAAKALAPLPPIPGGILGPAEEAITNRVRAHKWTRKQLTAWLMEVFQVQTITELTEAQGDDAFALLNTFGTPGYDAILAEMRASKGAA
jgi:hypothetical protein